MKQEEFQYNREDYCFATKKVVIVESHNFVLPAWAEYCGKTKREYRLVTFDHHMDTRPIYSQYAYKKCDGDMGRVNSYIEQRKIYDKYIESKYDVAQIVEMTRLYVYHDEHIPVAYNMGYISQLYEL